MYGIDKETWDRMVKGYEFYEVYIPSKGGLEKARKRKKYWEGRGREVIPYEDKWIDKSGKTRWVSVGIYVMKKEKSCLKETKSQS